MRNRLERREGTWEADDQNLPRNSGEDSASGNHRHQAICYSLLNEANSYVHLQKCWHPSSPLRPGPSQRALSRRAPSVRSLPRLAAPCLLRPLAKCRYACGKSNAPLTVQAESRFAECRRARVGVTHLFSVTVTQLCAGSRRLVVAGIPQMPTNACGCDASACLPQIEVDKPLGLTLEQSDAAGGGLVVKVSSHWRGSPNLPACGGAPCADNSLPI